MKKVISALMLAVMLCSIAAVSFAANPEFAFQLKSGASGYGSTAIPKNDSEQLCYVTTNSAQSSAQAFYVRSRTYVGDHEASQAMQLTTQKTYKLSYTVRTGIAGTKYSLKGQCDQAVTVTGRWNP